MLETQRSSLWMMRRFYRIVPILLAVIFFGCGGEDQTAPGAGRNGTMSMIGDRTAAIPVQVAKVERGDIAMFLQHTTTIEAEKQVDVLAKVSGQVVKLHVEEGMLVKRGQLLAELEEVELEIELIQTRARMETDRAAYERAKNMLEKQLIAEEAYETARLQYESSKATYEAAKLKIEYTKIKSPIDGVVTARHIELGQRINLNQLLFSIADFNPLRARIYVPEKDIRRIYEGQAAKLRVDAVPGVEFEGIVRMISPVVDPTSGTVKVTLDIKNPNQQLKPGMFATVYITTESHTNTLIIPKRALLLESEGDQVFVYDNGRARRARLKLGFVSGDRVEVLGGLKDGDLVVTIGQEGLRDGLPITVPGMEPSMTQADDSSIATATVAADAGAESGSREKKVDPAMVARVEKLLESNRRVQQEIQNRIQEDPDFANNPAKKQAYFEELVDRWANFVLRGPEAQAAWQQRVSEDPDFENNLEKKVAFFNEIFSKMRQRGAFGGRRQN